MTLKTFFFIYIHRRMCGGGQEPRSQHKIHFLLRIVEKSVTRGSPWLIHQTGYSNTTYATLRFYHRVCIFWGPLLYTTAREISTVLQKVVPTHTGWSNKYHPEQHELLQMKSFVHIMFHKNKLIWVRICKKAQATISLLACFIRNLSDT